jgi:predicted SAM-dependent methyltransferase
MEPDNMVTEIFGNPLGRLLRAFLSERTISFLRTDALRLRARILTLGRSNLVPPSDLLHLGCGARRIQGWLNVDLVNSDFDIDLAGGRLPWKDKSFQAIVAQHVVEHLDLLDELVPILSEFRRVLKPKGQIWVSSPDLEKICNSYIKNRMADLLEDRKTRFPYYGMGHLPVQYMINDFFHQYDRQSNSYGFKSLEASQGAHKNLYDFDILEWAFQTSGFQKIVRVSEVNLLSRFPSFPARSDDLQSIYVFALVD